MPFTTPPSGQQFEIRHRAQRAVVVEVGGGLRRYDVEGRHVLDPYPRNEICDGAHGATLVPWPNRLGDGRYTFDGHAYQVPLTEPTKHNAIHGFLRWRSWQAREKGPDRVVVGTVLRPQPYFPFTLDVTVEYALDDSGLTVRTRATNLDGVACIYGAGHHPYLSPGNGLIDDCLLEFGAATRIVTDDDRRLPLRDEQVAGTEYDFLRPRKLGALRIDFAFSELVRVDGRTRVRLTGPDGRCAEIWADEGYPYLELYTGDTLEPARRRRGLGVEPMTCPPNALQSGRGVVRLEPGESITTTWGALLV